MSESALPQLFLKEQAFVCLTNNTLVFLDLHNDKYSCLETNYTKSIAALLGLSVPPTLEKENSTSVTNEDTAKVVQDLINTGIATRDSSKGKRAEFIPQYHELREMHGYLPGEGPKIRADHLFNFFKSLFITKLLLRFSSMERTVMRVKYRKDRYYDEGGTDARREQIHKLVEIFKTLKPLFINVKDECLFNSLFLIEFLACYNIYPSWYFGVRLNEFYAHCWVQGGNIIYDDYVYNTHQNQPIMAV